MDGDVVVVGGGVAGLAAANRIAQSGRRVLVLEARSRIGGRIHTLRDETGHPVELGAEFVQGRPPGLLELIHRTDLTLQQIPERHERARRGRARALPNIEELVDRLLDEGASRGDVPVAQLIREQARRFSSEEIETLTAYLEGFHAADLERFGSAALAENQQAEKADEGHLARIAGGYAELVARLASGLDLPLGQIRTEAVVTTLRWTPGAVEVEVQSPAGESGTIAVSQAILALPLGALTLGLGEVGAVSLDPMPSGWANALPALEMGHAHRIVLRFESAWWLKQHEDAPGFFHGRDEPFPVFWTSSPPTLPFLTGWVGGPRALKLTGKPLEELVDLAVLSAASIFGMDPTRLRRAVTSAYHHDWTSDPFARGAYSYGGVGASVARELLRRSVSNTLFLAGEGLADEGHNATVPGALSTGLAAAAALLREGAL